MAYFSLLVLWGVFKEIELGFLPVGHTHEDIDQMFSRFSIALEANDAVIVSDLLRVCQKAYHPTPKIEEMKYQLNFKDKLDRDGRLYDFKGLPGIADPLAFRFVKGVDGKVGVTVKRKHSDIMWLNELMWEGVEPDMEHTDPHHFINSHATPLQFFSSFPSSIRKAIDFKELSEIRDSVENCPRIDNNAKLQHLRCTIDELAENRIDSFSRDLNLYGINENEIRHACDHDSELECNDQLASVNDDRQYASESQEAQTTLGPQILVADVGSKFLYTKDTMLLIRPDKEEDKKSPFWLARVLRDVPIPRRLREVPEVEIVWYDPARKDQNNNEVGMFFECTQKVGKKMIPRTDTNCSSTVIQLFAKLEKDQIAK